MPQKEIPTSKLRDLIARVATRSMTYHFYHWDWGESICIEGLWCAYRVTREPRFADFVMKMLDGWMAHSPDPWYPDHVGPGRLLVSLWQQTGNWRYLAYAKSLGEFLANLPRTAFGAYLHRPDLPDRSRMVWVDSMQTDAPFLCHLGRATGQTRWFDAGVEHILGHIETLQDRESKLFYHAYDDAGRRTNRVAWARGNGWAILGLVGALEALPKDHSGYPALLRSLEGLIESLKGWQEEKSKLWHTVVNNPGTYPEASGSLMIADATLHAVRRGLLPESYASLGAFTWEALWECVTPDGTVQSVSARTPAHDDPEAYNRVPSGGLYPWGQGAYLLAATRYLEDRME